MGFFCLSAGQGIGKNSSVLNSYHGVIRYTLFLVLNNSNLCWSCVRRCSKGCCVREILRERKGYIGLGDSRSLFVVFDLFI